MKTESGLRVQEEDLGGPASTGESSAQSPGLVDSTPKPSHSISQRAGKIRGARAGRRIVQSGAQGGGSRETFQSGAPTVKLFEDCPIRPAKCEESPNHNPGRKECQEHRPIRVGSGHASCPSEGSSLGALALLRVCTAGPGVRSLRLSPARAAGRTPGRVCSRKEMVSERGRAQHWEGLI